MRRGRSYTSGHRATDGVGRDAPARSTPILITANVSTRTRGAAEALVKRISWGTLVEHELQAKTWSLRSKTAPECEFPDVRASLPVGSGGRPSGASDDCGLARMNLERSRQAARQDRCDAGAIAARRGNRGYRI